MPKYNFIDRENWIKSFQPNYEKQSWHGDKVLHPTEIKYFEYFRRYNSYVAIINPKDIVGIEYAYDYNCPSTSSRNINWNNLLQSLKRLDKVIDNFKDKESLIEHIHRNEDSKNVLKFGNYFFTTSGQHRLCLAKYLELNEVEVFVTEYKLEKKILIRELKIEKYYPKLLEFGLVSDGYRKDRDFDFLPLNLKKDTIWIRKELIETLIKRCELINSRFYKIIPNIIKSFFDTNNNRWIKKKEELYKLDYYIFRQIKKAVANTGYAP